MGLRKEDDQHSSEYNHASYCRGCKYFDAEDFVEAIKCFKEALEYWPEDPQAWMALGNCYSELKRHKKAEESFQRALELSEEENVKEGIIYNLGNSLSDQQRYLEAVEMYERIRPGSEVWRLAQLNVRFAKSRI